MVTSLTTVLIIGIVVIISVSTNMISSSISSEKLNIIAYSNPISNGWQEMQCIEVQIQNTGSTISAINGIYLNDYAVTYSPSPPSSGSASTDLPMNGINLKPNQEYKIKIFLNNYGTLSSGTMVTIRLHTTAGTNFLQTIQLT